MFDPERDPQWQILAVTYAQCGQFVPERLGVRNVWPKVRLGSICACAASAATWVVVINPPVGTLPRTFMQRVIQLLKAMTRLKAGDGVTSTKSSLNCPIRQNKSARSRDFTRSGSVNPNFGSNCRHPSIEAMDHIGSFAPSFRPLN